MKSKRIHKPRDQMKTRPSSSPSSSWSLPTSDSPKSESLWLADSSSSPSPCCKESSNSVGLMLIRKFSEYAVGHTSFCVVKHSLQIWFGTLKRYFPTLGARGTTSWISLSSPFQTICLCPTTSTMLSCNLITTAPNWSKTKTKDWIRRTQSKQVIQSIWLQSIWLGLARAIRPTVRADPHPDPKCWCLLKGLWGTFNLRACTWNRLVTNWKINF